MKKFINIFVILIILFIGFTNITAYSYADFTCNNPPTSEIQYCAQNGGTATCNKNGIACTIANDCNSDQQSNCELNYGGKYSCTRGKVTCQFTITPFCGSDMTTKCENISPQGSEVCSPDTNGGHCVTEQVINPSLGINNFLNTGNVSGPNPINANVGGVGGAILNVINVALLIVGLVTLAIIFVAGFKYITSAGDKGEIEKSQKTLTSAVIGLILIAFSFFITGFLLNFFCIPKYLDFSSLFTHNFDNNTTCTRR